MIVQGESPLALFLGLAVSLLINLLSENAGYYVLLPLVMAGIYSHQLSVRSIIKPKSIISFAILFVVVYFVSGVAIYSEKPFRQVIVERLVDVVDTKAEIDDSGPTGRGKIMKIATKAGGWFGRGIGAYSDIYQLEGYDSSSVFGQQININEATHLNAESGRVGYVLTIVVYILFLLRLFDGLRYKVVASVLFIICTYYTAVLMNESHFFMFSLMMFFFAVHEKRRLVFGKNIRCIRACAGNVEA